MSDTRKTLHKFIKKVDAKGQLVNIGVLFASTSEANDKNVYVSYSKYNIKKAKKPFDKKLGLKIAQGRVEHAPHSKQGNIVIPYLNDETFQREIYDFINRCIRYFKDKHVITPIFSDKELLVNSQNANK